MQFENLSESLRRYFVQFFGDEDTVKNIILTFQMEGEALLSTFNITPNNTNQTAIEILAKTYVTYKLYEAAGDSDKVEFYHNQFMEQVSMTIKGAKLKKEEETEEIIEKLGITVYNK